MMIPIVVSSTVSALLPRISKASLNCSALSALSAVSRHARLPTGASSSSRGSKDLCLLRPPACEPKRKERDSFPRRRRLDVGTVQNKVWRRTHSSVSFDIRSEQGSMKTMEVYHMYGEMTEMLDAASKLK